MQEEMEFKDLKIIEYEQDKTSSTGKIKLESIEEKIKFIISMLNKLREIHNKNT